MKIENIEFNETIQTSSNCENFPLMINSIEKLPPQEKLSPIEETESQNISNFENIYSNLENTRLITNLEMKEKIADYLESIPEIRYENWCKLSLDKRKETLNKIEQKIAEIEIRTPMSVEVEKMNDRTIGYNQFYYNKIAVNQKYVESNDPEMHKRVIMNIIHEGRHAYQHYNVDVRTVHESSSEVAEWKKNFSNSEYGYYRYKGQRVYVALADGSVHDIGFRIYENQPVEIDARAFSRDVMLKLENKDIVVSKPIEEQIDMNTNHDIKAAESIGSEFSSMKCTPPVVHLTDREKYYYAHKTDILYGFGKPRCVNDWNDSKNPISESDDNVVYIIKDPLTGQLYAEDTLTGDRSVLTETTPKQRDITRCKYTYKNQKGYDMVIADI